MQPFIKSWGPFLTGLLLLLLLWLPPSAVDVPELVERTLLPPSTQTVQQAQSGDPVAQFQLAAYHLTDDNPSVMLYWLHQSAQQNYLPAILSLATLYETGDTVPLDRVQAYRWYDRAAALGDEDAVRAVGALSVELTEAEWRQVQIHP